MKKIISLLLTLTLLLSLCACNSTNNSTNPAPSRCGDRAVDFGDTHIGRHTSMAFEATGGDGKDKPADFLAIPELAAVLAKLEVVEGCSRERLEPERCDLQLP